MEAKVGTAGWVLVLGMEEEFALPLPLAQSVWEMKPLRSRRGSWRLICAVDGAAATPQPMDASGSTGMGVGRAGTRWHRD